MDTKIHTGVEAWVKLLRLPHKLRFDPKAQPFTLLVHVLLAELSLLTMLYCLHTVANVLLICAIGNKRELLIINILPDDRQAYIERHLFAVAPRLINILYNMSRNFDVIQ